MNALEWYRNISERPISLGLSNKVKNRFEKKDSVSTFTLTLDSYFNCFSDLLKDKVSHSTHKIEISDISHDQDFNTIKVEAKRYYKDRNDGSFKITCRIDLSADKDSVDAISFLGMTIFSRGKIYLEDDLIKSMTSEGAALLVNLIVKNLEEWCRALYCAYGGRRMFENNSNLGLANKVKKAYSEKSSDDLLNMFDYVVDKETFMKVLDYYRISYDDASEDSSWNQTWRQTVYVCTSLSIDNKPYMIRIVFKKGYMTVCDSPFDRYIVEKARDDEEFRKYCIQENKYVWQNLLEYVKFEVSEEHPLPKIVLDTIIEGIKDYKSIYEKYGRR